MYALSEMLDSAKECIFILVCSCEIRIGSLRFMYLQDWWLTPELYLRSVFLRTIAASDELTC